MCLAVPGKILEIDGDTARVDFGGITREANVILVPEAAVDSYVLVHAGFAIQVLNEAEAEETLSLFRQLAEALDSVDERGAAERNADEPEHDVADGAERGGA